MCMKIKSNQVKSVKSPHEPFPPGCTKLAKKCKFLTFIFLCRELNFFSRERGTSRKFMCLFLYFRNISKFHISENTERYNFGAICFPLKLDNFRYNILKPLNSFCRFSLFILNEYISLITSLLSPPNNETSFLSISILLEQFHLLLKNPHPKCDARECKRCNWFSCSLCGVITCS